jgi:hypothetical protein
MAGDHLELGIDQDRQVEAERLDAAGDLPDLLARVAAGIDRIGFELADRAVDHLNPLITVRSGTGGLHCKILSVAGFVVGAGSGRRPACQGTGRDRSAKTPAEADSDGRWVRR